MSNAVVAHADSPPPRGVRQRLSSGIRTPGAPAGPLAKGLRAARITVISFLLTDAVTSWVLQAMGRTDLGPTGPLAVVQVALILVACGAAMWERRRLAIALAIPLAVVAVAHQAVGSEPDLVLILTGTIVLRGTRRAVLVTTAAMLAYAVAFGFHAEHFYPGHGLLATLLLLGYVTVALALGLTVRALLAARDRRRAAVVRMEQALPQIRAQEREQLAQELQALMNNGIAAIEREVAAALRGPGDHASLRRTLESIDEGCRELLAQLRSLLGVLRQEPMTTQPTAPTPTAPSESEPEAEPDTDTDPAEAEHVTGAGRRIATFATRYGRWAMTGVFGLLAVRAAIDLALAPRPTALVILLGVIAWTVAAWSTRAAAITAGSAVALAVVPAAHTPWLLVPGALVLLWWGLRLEARHTWLLVAGLIAYTAVLALTAPTDAAQYMYLVLTLGTLLIPIAAVARHLLAAHAQTGREQQAVTDAQDEMAAQERSAVARDLHDVLARQLSLTTMQIMASSHSTDPQELFGTVQKVGTNAARARAELETLVRSMRSPAADPEDLAPPISPQELAHRLTEDLTTHRFRPEFHINPGIARLDAPTQRTVGRVMQEATTNILRYAPPGTACRFGVDLGARTLRLRIDSALAKSRRSDADSLGWGLLGVRERIDLLGGSFAAGPSDGGWAVVADLPLRSAPTSTAEASAVSAPA